MPTLKSIELERLAGGVAPANGRMMEYYCYDVGEYEKIVYNLAAFRSRRLSQTCEDECQLTKMLENVYANFLKWYKCFAALGLAFCSCFFYPPECMNPNLKGNTGCLYAHHYW